MKKAYPIVLTPVADGYSVYVPDLQINSEGSSLADAIAMARDAIGMWGCYEQDEKRGIPEPSELSTVEHKAGDTVTLVDVDFDEYRRKHDKRVVRKNVTIPSWLNEEAERAGINFSGALQTMLKQQLHIDQP